MNESNSIDIKFKTKRVGSKLYQTKSWWNSNKAKMPVQTIEDKSIEHNSKDDMSNQMPDIRISRNQRRRKILRASHQGSFKNTERHSSLESIEGQN